MPLERVGKLRESLTISSEVYKKLVLRYLEARGYYVKASSDVEATLADAILTRKGETRDYWLEVKETSVSLGDSSFLRQLADYLAKYLSGTPDNRFKMILVCCRILDFPLFEKVYAEFEKEAIDGVISKMLESSKPDIRAVIENASSKDIKKFFEDSTVKEIDLKQLELAQEKIKPIPPGKPNLPEAEYAAKVMANFGEISPIKSPDRIVLNLFHLDLPSKIQVAQTLYRKANDLFAEKPYVSFPAYDLDNGQIVTFDEFTKDNPLSSFIVKDSNVSFELQKFTENEDNKRIIIKILNRWIKNRCRKMGLEFDDRTRTYYYSKSDNGDGSVNVEWKAKSKNSNRELTKPMKTDEKTNFWVHRGAIISAKNFWGENSIQIRPRFLFSSDGISLFEGAKADKLDRKFRKSKYNRNLNQMYDVLFWYRHIFPETRNLSTANLDLCLGFKAKQSIRVLEQINVDCEAKPNIELAEIDEELEKLETTSSQIKKLEDFT